MAKHVRKKETPLIDMGSIVQYVVMTIIFALLIFGVKYVVLWAVHQSPTGQCGNGVLTLFETHNTGAAFNLFANQPEMIISASVLAALAIAFCAIVLSGKLSRETHTAMALLTAGISMNAAERITNGYVIDYISCNFAPGFPVFNTADIMIVIGAFCLLFSVFTKR